MVTAQRKAAQIAAVEASKRFTFGRDALTPMQLSEFDESKHPRADDGKFGAKGGGFKLENAPPKAKAREFETTGGGKQKSFLSQGTKHGKDLPGQQTLFDVDSSARPERKEAVAVTVDSALDRYMDENRDRFGASPERAAKRVKAVLNKVKKGGWSKSTELRGDNLSGEMLTAHGKLMGRLKKSGAVDVAWDKGGEPHYALAGSPLPKWLTQSDDDSVLDKLPERGDEK